MSDTNTTRRGLLKKTGAVTGGLAIVGSGVVSASPSLSVEINPLESNTQGDLNAIEDRVDDFLMLVEYYCQYSGSSSVSFSYDVTVGDEIDWDGSASECTQWISDLGAAKHSEMYKDIHIVVSDVDRFARASENPDYKAWTSTTCFEYVGTSENYDSIVDNPKERYKNAAVQEMIHLMVDESVADNVSNGRHGEHTLGKIRDDGSSTPALTFYENGNSNPCWSNGGDDLSGQSPCAGDTSWNGTHGSVTDCTLEAIKQTIEANGM